MELTFYKEGKRFYTEFEITQDSNLHLEFKKGTTVNMYQSTPDGGKYDYIEDSSKYFGDVIDIDLIALVYPKRIRIVSPNEPSYAAITTDGEVTEIKSQSKDVEITANGVTEIAPDNGFGYLSGVKVNVNVPSGGSGGSSGGGEVDHEYLDIRGVDPMYLEGLIPFITLVRVDTQGGASIGPPLFITMMGAQITIDLLPYVAIDKNARLVLITGDNVQTVTFDMVMADEELASAYKAIPRITEEQFYSF